ncbi:hypothetical protein AB0Y38_05805 [Lysinibacillus capsici]|uniref:hypothetical protein n=1 Tax=Lysinibacillus capsici TaxID=2115968 RepID=UPI003F22BB1D
MKIPTFLDIMNQAKDTPSEKCINDKEHNFEFLLHADGKDFYSYYFQCKACEEVIVEKKQRTGTDKALWDF